MGPDRRTKRGEGIRPAPAPGGSGAYRPKADENQSIQNENNTRPIPVARTGRPENITNLSLQERPQRSVT